MNRSRSIRPLRARSLSLAAILTFALCMLGAPHASAAPAPQPPAPAPPATELIPSDPAAWTPFAPRQQNAPASEVLKRGNGYALRLASNGTPFVYGGWRYRAEGIAGESWYRFRARAIPRNVQSLRESVTVQLRWRGEFGTNVAPTYVWDFRRLDSPPGAIEFDRLVQAPPRARAVELELVLQWTERGEVVWEDVSLTPAAAPPPRNVKVAAVWLRPRGSKTPADSVEQVAAFTEKVAAEHRPDIIVVGETINHAGAPGSLDEKAEPIPGPATERFGEIARRHSAYIVVGLVERAGRDLFNTGVLLDRTGRIAGIYRKVKIPFEELANGIAPGDALPAFDTDFGRVGILICHDTSFPEPARELSINGAELILVPIWGGRQTLVRARAMENGVFLATGGYDYDSEIIDPLGRVLASVPNDQGPAVAVATINLNHRYREDWIGDWRDTVNKQRRSIPFTAPIP
jgi:predicted amidohydrolase